jgi:hypothetical protein
MSKLYTAKDISKCYPWISPGTINHRVQQQFLKLENPSPGTGIPNMFTEEEVVHCAVLDELATLGVFGKLHTSPIHTTSINYREPYRDEKGQKMEKSWGSPDPFYVDLPFYRRLNYRVIVMVRILHEDIAGVNVHEVRFLEPTPEIPFQHIEPIPRGWGRYYYVMFAPEEFEGESFVQKQLDYWFDPKKKRVTRVWASHGFISVRKLYELAADALGLPE